MTSIMIVCNNEKNREGYKSILANRDYMVTFVTDGWDCYDNLRKSSYDMVILEQSTTGMTSFELCKKLKDNPDTVKTMVVIITNDFTVKTRKHCYEVDCDAILPLPLDDEELQLIVNRLLRSRFILKNTENKLKLLNSLTMLLHKLNPEIKPDDYSTVLKYANSMLMNMPYKKYERELALEAIRFHSYYKYISTTSSVRKTIDNFLENFSIGQWLIPTLTYVRYNSCTNKLNADEKAILKECRTDLTAQGFFPIIHMADMLLSFNELCKTAPSKMDAFTQLCLIKDERDYHPAMLEQLKSFIIAEDIFSEI